MFPLPFSLYDNEFICRPVLGKSLKLVRCIVRFSTAVPLSQIGVLNCFSIGPIICSKVAKRMRWSLTQMNRYAAQGLGLRTSTLSLTQLYGSLPFVPFGDFSGRPFLRMVSDPARDFFIGCPGGYEAPERIVLQLSELQPPLIEREVGEVIALPPDKCRPAFVQRARSQCIPTELLSRAARELFVVPQIASQQFYFFKVFFHGFPLFLRSFSPPQFFSSHVVIQFVIARIATVDRIRTTVPLLRPQAAEAIQVPVFLRY